MTQDLDGVSSNSEKQPEAQSTIAVLRRLFSDFDNVVITFFKSAIKSIPILVPLAVVSGFIIVNSFLSNYTTITTYNITFGQYIAASIQGTVFGILLYVGFQMIIGVVIPLKAVRDYVREAKKPNQSERMKIKLSEYVPSDARLTIVASICIIVGSLVYGPFIYGHIPRYLGGGTPVAISILFTGDDVPKVFNVSTLNSHSSVVSNVLLLAELNDGILIYDPISQASGIIKNSEIRAI